MLCHIDSFLEVGKQVGLHANDAMGHAFPLLQLLLLWIQLIQDGLVNRGRVYAKENWKDREGSKPYSDSILSISSVSCHHNKDLLTRTHSIGPCSWYVIGVTHDISFMGFGDSQNGISGPHYHMDSKMQPEPQLHNESQKGTGEL